MKPNDDKGFTLIEVMVALAIVAIVSTSLLRMFSTTSYVNHEAQVMDWANTSVVQQGETFKADPEDYRLEHGANSYAFYKENGTFIEEYPDLTIVPEGATIMIKSDSQEPIDDPSNVPDTGYYPDFAITLDLSKYSSDIDVTVSDSSVIKVKPSVSSLVIDSTKITSKAIPIRVDYTEGVRTINVTNDSDKEVECYIFNTAKDTDVIINTIRGSSSRAFVETPKTVPNKGYLLTLTVSRLKNGVWVEKLNYSASANNYSTN